MTALVLVHRDSPDALAAVELLGRLAPPGEPRVLRVVAQPEWGWGPRRWARLQAVVDSAEVWGRELLGRAQPHGTADAQGWTVEVGGPPAAAPAVSLLVVDRLVRRVVLERTLRGGIAVAWPGSSGAFVGARLPYRGPPHRLLAPLTWLRERNLDVVAVPLDGSDPPATPAQAQALLGFPLRFEAPPGPPRMPLASLRELLAGNPDLVALPTSPGPALWAELLLLRELESAGPVVMVPTSEPVLSLRPQLQCTDFVPTPTGPRGGVVRVDALGRAKAVDGESVGLVVGGAVVRVVDVREGELTLPELGSAVVGVAEPAAGDLRGLRAAGRVLDGSGPPVRLVLAGEAVEGERCWVVRFDGDAPDALRGPGVDAVVDGEAVLDDGRSQDLPDAVDPARLDRVRRRLVAWGLPVLDGPAPPVDDSLGERLRVLAGAQATTARTLDLLLDNGAARTSLIDRIDGARRSVWLQTFMFEGDPVGEAVAAALRRALDRGIDVRVLVDSVFAGHGALGRSNPLLKPLAEVVRAARPVAEFADLRRRDHRKLLVIDGRHARVSGRNIGEPYFTGFDEVELTPRTPVRGVPWLDAGVEATGAVVGLVEAAFADAWADAGGEVEAAVVAAEPVDGIRCHLVLHETLEDVHTLEAYRVLLESARERVTLVNSFPLQFELQRVLHRLLARGVEVRFLVGTVRPAFGAGTPFPGEAARGLANEVVLGRLDPLIEAGADVRALVLRGRDRWDPAIDRLLPHVHAKLLSVDGQVCTVGSANVDTAASYWDSEALLVVEDAGFTGRLDDRLDALFAGSERFDRADPAWQEAARRRRDLSLNWPGWAT